MTSSPTPQNPDFATDIRAGFAAQGFMRLIGAELSRLEPGLVEIRMPFSVGLTQHNGFLHAGVVTALCDNACGFAALSLMEAGKNVLSAEFKLNLLAPAAGEVFYGQGQVLRAGRTLTVCQGDVYAGEDRKHVATMLATMIAR